MKKDQIKGNLYAHVQLVPSACRLDAELGIELPDIDDDWLIRAINEDGIEISNIRTGHCTTLGYDHIHHFTTNPDRSRNGMNYGFLSLHVQVFVRGNEVWVRPNLRPGERVAPATPTITERTVEIGFPSKSGMQQKLLDSGFKISWVRPERAHTLITLEGYAEVLYPDSSGGLSKFRTRDGLILPKSRVA